MGIKIKTDQIQTVSFIDSIKVFIFVLYSFICEEEYFDILIFYLYCLYILGKVDEILSVLP